MAKSRERPTARSTAKTCLLYAAASFLAAGCSELNRSTTADPLLGGPGLKASAGTIPPPPPAGAALTGLQQPPPASSGSMSTAALASATPRPRDNDLRIADPRATTTSAGWTGQGAAAVPRAPAEGNGAVLRAPEPVTEAASGQSAVQPVVSVAGLTTTPRSSARLATYEQAQSQLASRGVLWQRLENVGDNGDWKFTCSVPSRQNPRARRTHEASAHDYLSAIQAVLDQIDKEQ